MILHIFLILYMYRITHFQDFLFSVAKIQFFLYDQIFFAIFCKIKEKRRGSGRICDISRNAVSDTQSTGNERKNAVLAETTT